MDDRVPTCLSAFGLSFVLRFLTMANTGRQSRELLPPPALGRMTFGVGPRIAKTEQLLCF